MQLSPADRKPWSNVRTFFQKYLVTSGGHNDTSLLQNSWAITAQNCSAAGQREIVSANGNRRFLL